MILALGEIMLRLKAVDLERFFQSPSFEATFGGAEANVVASLAQFGLPAGFVTALPQNAIADACMRHLSGFGVDTSRIVRQGERIGLYYLEAGANQRPSKVVYDRANSAMATAKSADFAWEEIFTGVDWLHLSGITPAISQTGADIALHAVQAAKAHGLTVSCDNNYRSKLWQYGKLPVDVMPELVRYVDLLIANEEDCRLSLGVASEDRSPQAVAATLFAAFPNLKYQAMTMREGFSASHNGWSACLYNGSDFFVSQRYEIAQIVDRVGAGDAFAAGLIYGIHTRMPDQETLNFAVAASCLKHSIAGDVNLCSVAEVRELMAGDASGRVQR